MSESTWRYFERVIKERYDVDSSYERTEQVHVAHEGQTIWSGPVHVFKLHQHPDSRYCYAWDELHPTEPFTRHRTTTILDKGENASAKQAVELAIYLRHKQDQEGSPT